MRGETGATVPAVGETLQADSLDIWELLGRVWVSYVLHQPYFGGIMETTAASVNFLDVMVGSAAYIGLCCFEWKAWRANALSRESSRKMGREIFGRINTMEEVLPWSAAKFTPAVCSAWACGIVSENRTVKTNDFAPEYYEQHAPCITHPGVDYGCMPQESHGVAGACVRTSSRRV